MEASATVAPMELLVLLGFVLILAHVASIYVIMDGMKGISEEFRQIVLERENTQRLFYAAGPEVTTDNPEQASSLEVV